MPDRDEYPIYEPTCDGEPLARYFDSGGPDYYIPNPIGAAIADFEAYMAEHVRTCDRKHTVRVTFGWKCADRNNEYDYPPGMPEQGY